jgi:hypothetical protein
MCGGSNRNNAPELILYPVGIVLSANLRDRWSLNYLTRLRTVSVDRFYWYRVSVKSMESVGGSQVACGGGLPFFITSIRFRGQFNDRVQGNLDVGQINLREIVEVAITKGRRTSNSDVCVTLRYKLTGIGEWPVRHEAHQNPCKFGSQQTS